jgi:hypothetical protein
MQALAQYLVNLNIWTHNLLVLLGRASDRAQAVASHAQCGGSHSSPAGDTQGDDAPEVGRASGKQHVRLDGVGC